MINWRTRRANVNSTINLRRLTHIIGVMALKQCSIRNSKKSVRAPLKAMHIKVQVLLNVPSLRVALSAVNVRCHAVNTAANILWKTKNKYFSVPVRWRRAVLCARNQYRASLTMHRLVSCIWLYPPAVNIYKRCVRRKKQSLFLTSTKYS